MTRKPSMSAAARTRRERKALRREMERVSALVDQRLAEAVREGLISLVDLPADVAQRLLALDERVLQGHVEGDRVVIEVEGGQQFSTKTQFSGKISTRT